MIRLDQFATGATEALKEAITEAKEKGATGIVFDLRSNPGGYVNEAVGVASQFVGDGIVYQAFDRSGEQKDAKVEPGGLATDIPVVVLANGDTASSAEIVTGAIQDAGAARSWARRRSGPARCSGGSTSRTGRRCGSAWSAGSPAAGRPIWHEGLDPDVKVELAEDAQPLLPDDPARHDARRSFAARARDAPGCTQRRRSCSDLIGRRWTAAGPGNRQRPPAVPAAAACR